MDLGKRIMVLHTWGWIVSCVCNMKIPQNVLKFVSAEIHSKKGSSWQSFCWPIVVECRLSNWWHNKYVCDEYFYVWFIYISPSAKPSVSLVAVVFNLLYLIPSTHNSRYLLTGIVVSFFSNNSKYLVIKQLVEELFWFAWICFEI